MSRDWNSTLRVFTRRLRSSISRPYIKKVPRWHTLKPCGLFLLVPDAPNGTRIFTSIDPIHLSQIDVPSKYSDPSKLVILRSLPYNLPLLYKFKRK